MAKPTAYLSHYIYNQKKTLRGTKKDVKCKMDSVKDRCVVTMPYNVLQYIVRTRDDLDDNFEDIFYILREMRAGKVAMPRTASSGLAAALRSD